MTAPIAATNIVIDGITVTPDTLVLQRRPLHTASARQSRFGDPIWDLFPALPDQHSANQKIHWSSYPPSLQLSCKYYIFALLNIVEYAPRIATARTSVPSIKTIWSDLVCLRRFLKWLEQNGIKAFSDIGEIELDRYYAHVIAQPAKPTRRRKDLLAVQRLYYYGDFLPPSCRIDLPTIWGGVSAALLADAPAPNLLENRTPRIPPEIMETLLSAALLVIDQVADDVRPVVRQLVEMRTLAARAAPEIRRRRVRDTSRWFATQAHLAEVIEAFRQAGHALPGRPNGGAVVIDLKALAIAAQLDHDMLRRNCGGNLITESEMPTRNNLLRIPRTNSIDGRPWRNEPIETAELPTIIRHLTAACFLVIVYLSGIRTGEALNLRRGCVTHDDRLQMIFLSGRQSKTQEDRAERSPHTIPWVINPQVAKAVEVLEDFAPGAYLFPAGQFGSPEWIASERATATGSINSEIMSFVDWFNTNLADTTGHARIPVDAAGNFTGMRLRRTLAWHIVHRPGGTIAAATQYGHVHTQITNGYSGQADAGFGDEISFEQFLLRTEQIHRDHQLLENGEHVSGPAADTYRDRISRAHKQFDGITLSSKAQAKAAASNPNLQVHHGALLTCVWRPESAKCTRTAEATGENAPQWSRCRLNCTNIAYTDRDVDELRTHVKRLTDELASETLPMPLARRVFERLEKHKVAIETHHASRPK